MLTTLNVKIPATLVGLALSTVLLNGCATTAASTTQPAAVASYQVGDKTLLTGQNHMTLYTFDKDSAGQSACYDACAAKWPPLLAQSNDKATGEYSVVARNDGTRQWAYEGKPLYFWFKDQAPGDTTGDGIKGVWHIIELK